MDPINPVAENPEVLSQSPIPPKTPQTRNYLVLILSALTIIAVALAGFFYFQIQKLSKELSKYQPQTSPTPVATADPTANWKTYTSSQFGFLFKYPNTWTVENPVPEDTNAIVTITADEKIGEAVDPIVYRVRVSKTDKSSIQKFTDLEEVDELSKEFTVYKTAQELSRSGMLTYIFTKDDVNFIKLSLDPFASEVTSTYPKFPKQDIYLATFNQILSTFKLTQ